MSKSDIRIELGSLGIISGEQKRSLECYLDSRHFQQRKTYDEYTINDSNAFTALDLNDLRILAEEFTVRVLEDSVMISDR